MLAYKTDNDMYVCTRVCAFDHNLRYGYGRDDIIARHFGMKPAFG